jgi:membrane-associated protease RseP (regulator of RpoE activity)
LNVLWYYLIVFVAIYILAIIFRDKLKVDFYGPILMRRTQKMRGWINSIAQFSPRFWRWTMNIGVIIAIGGMIISVYVFIMALTNTIQTPQISQVGILLPGVDVPGSPVFIPVVSGLIAIISVLVIHEFAHGILARAEGVGIKSIGVFFLGFIPGGAFVELDEESFAKAKRSSKLRISAAGSISNFSLGLIGLAVFWVISSLFIPYAFQSDGLTIASVTPNGPSEGILEAGMVVTSINGYPVNGVDLSDLMGKFKPGDKLTFVTDQGTFIITAGANPSNQSRAYAGNRYEQHLVIKPEVSKILGNIIPWFLYDLSDVCYYIFLLNIMIGLVNLLPMKPLDGAAIFEEILTYKIPKEFTNRITSSVSVVFWGIWGILIIYGLVPGIMQMF